ncbi:hypothetical protein BC941DRAFT_427591 [Chlamydoabsidia padenii]|nr:hypothetical protein BC941DRAFT_427591 [Chlamydoabsidia padenii]
MYKSHWFVRSCTIIQQRCSSTTSKRSTPALMSRLKKQRSDLNAIMEPRQTFYWAQKVLQSRWENWIYASKARYLSTSLFDLDAKQYNNLARDFAKAGANGQLASCLPSSILTDNVTRINNYKELVDIIDRRLTRSFYDYATPYLSLFMQQLKAVCRFSPLAWFPQTRSLTRSINIHIYDSSNLPRDLSQDALKEMANGSTIYCGNHTTIPSSTMDNHKGTIQYTTLSHLDYIVRHTPYLDTLILEGPSKQLDWRWTEAFLDTPATTVHILAAMDTTDERILLLKRVSDDRGEDCRVIDHRHGDTINSSYLPRRSLPLDTLFSWQDISPGDCIVVGSWYRLMDIKDRLEHYYGLKCAVLFHQLPKVIQLQQINDFNAFDHPSKVLLMSDDMTVPPTNINAKRLLFKSIKKQEQHGKAPHYQSINKIKQIVDMMGSLQGVAVFDKADVPFVRQALISDIPSTKHQVLQVLPSKNIFESFCKLLPEELSMSSKLEAFEVLTDVGGNYISSDWTCQKTIADWLEYYSISFDDQWIFMKAPVDISLAKCKSVLQIFGEAVSRGTPCKVDNVLGLPPTNLIESESLMTLVNQYEALQWYLWFR